jgi:hypothetical protein
VVSDNGFILASFFARLKAQSFVWFHQVVEARGVAGGESELKGKLLYFSASKVENIGGLDDESPFPDFPCCTPPLVIDHKQITQRFVNKVEADVAGNFLDRTVVLNQCVQEHIRGEGIVQTGGGQSGSEVS